MSNDSHRKAIVLYTDGGDKNSETSRKVISALMDDSAKLHNIDLYIIGVDKDNDLSDLKEIALAAAGRFFQINPEQAPDIAVKLASNL